MAAAGRVSVSLTETKHFRRLVDFLWEVEDYAAVQGDEDLHQMAQAVKADLVAFQSGPEDH